MLADDSGKDDYGCNLDEEIKKKSTINIPVKIFNAWAKYGMTKDEEKVFKALLYGESIGKEMHQSDVVEYTRLKQDKVENGMATLGIRHVIGIEIKSVPTGKYGDKWVINQPEFWVGYKDKSKKKVAVEKPIDTDVQEIFDYWNGKNIIIHRKLTRGPAGIEGHTVMSLKSNTKTEIKKAIDNYHRILTEDKYFWTYVYKLPRFLEVGIERFFDKAEPFKTFISREYVKNMKARETSAGVIDVDALVRKEEEDARRP